MNKRHWIYVGPFGRHNKIGLMHGPESGNLMIYYNDKIISIDFKVLESKSYKFFIDEKLCEIFVVKHKRKNQYKYEFKFDNKTRTEFNIKRNQIIRKQNIKGIALILAVPAVIGLIIFGYSFFRDKFLENQYANHQKATWASVKIITRGVSNYYETFYYFKTDNGEIVSSRTTTSAFQPKTLHGLPLENEDVFAVTYAENYTFYSRIDYDQPDVATSLKMMKRVAPVHLQYNQGRIQQELLCEVQAAFDTKGLDGLADIYYQTEAVQRNSKHNKDSFLRLKRDSPFQKAAEECWNEHVGF